MVYFQWITPRVSTGGPSSPSVAPRFWEKNQTKSALAQGDAAGDRFGTSVSISGPYIIVGAPAFGDPNDPNDDGVGYVRIFELSAGLWDPNDPDHTHTLERDPNDPEPGDRFGYAVSLSGDRAVIGAPGTGEVFVTKRTGITWPQPTQVATVAGTKFGWSVSISGAYIIVGAPGDDYVVPLGSRSDAGSAFVFELGQHEAGKWTWIDQSPHGDYNIILRPESPANGGRFGHSVCLAGEYTTASLPDSIL